MFALGNEVVCLAAWQSRKMQPGLVHVSSLRHMRWPSKARYIDHLDAIITAPD